MNKINIEEVITEDEKSLILMLGEAFNAFSALEELHPMDTQEFMIAIHTAQNIILARPALRYLSISKPKPTHLVRKEELLERYGRF